MEPPLVGVAGGLVLVGIGAAVAVEIAVPVAVGTICVAVGLPVGGGVNVGKGEGTGNVGNGVNVAPPKLNKAVGVAAVPCVGKIVGLGVTPGELRDGNKLARTEQTQQNARNNKLGRNIFPSCPC